MTDPPRVSVIIPAHNSTRHLADTIASVRAQTVPDWELVLLDDGSTDGTAELAESIAAIDPRVRVVSAVAGGVAAARNRGFAASRPGSEFVIFLDHDDVWEPELLATLIGVLDTHPGLVGAHGVARCIDGDGSAVPDDELETWLRDRHGYVDDRLVPRPPDEATRFADLVHANWVVTPGLLLVRRSARLAAGGFDPGAVPSDDWDMSVRLSRLGDLGYVDRVVLLWRRTADAQSFQSRRWLRAHFHVRRNMVRDRTSTAEQARVALLAIDDLGRSARRDLISELRTRRFRAAARSALISIWALGLHGQGFVWARLPRTGRPSP